MVHSDLFKLCEIQGYNNCGILCTPSIMPPHNGGPCPPDGVRRQRIRQRLGQAINGAGVLGPAERGVTGADRATRHANQGQHHYL